jgi:hypothetical protein
MFENEGFRKEELRRKEDANNTYKEWGYTLYII